MGEIWFPELIILFFLLLSLLRPFIKGLRPMDGLVWLPVVSFALILGIFPAYGFRPECIPLLVYTLILNIANIPQLIESAVSAPEEKRQEQNLFLAFIGLVLFCAAAVPLFAFSPRIPLELVSEGVQARTIRDETAKHDYFLRIYSPLTDENNPRPLVFLIPPEAGSVYAVDRICAGLRDQGFIVAAYSRRGLDFPSSNEGRKHYASPARINSMWQAFSNGTESNEANSSGKSLESERQKDIEFLLPLICRNQDENGAALIPGLSGAELPVFIAGYGAGGAAAAYLFEQPGFAARYGSVKGIAAIESRFWSSYQEAAPRRMEPQWLPQPDIPVLYIASDRVFPSPQRRSFPWKSGPNPYRAVFDIFTNTAGPAALAAFKGAGPFAYCDYPLTHPAYTFIFQGQMENARKSNAPVDDAAGYIGNFFLMLLHQAVLPPPDDVVPSADMLVPDDDFPAADISAPDDNVPALNPLIMPEKRPIASGVLLELRDLPMF